MQLTVRFRGAGRFDFGDHDYESLIRNTLDSSRHLLKKVSLYIEDVNGPRGGIDKQCRCVLHLKRMAPVVIRDQDDSMTSLLCRVAHRAEHTLRQKTNRIKQQRRQDRGARRQVLPDVEP